MQTFEELLLKERSYRRFKQDHAIERAVLEGLVDLGRLSASAANLQPLKYMLFCDEASTVKIFPHLMWAGYLTEWKGPSEGERPAAYIIILGDKEISENFGVDHGIAAQNIMLGAAAQGIGGCMIGSINRSGLRDTLGLPECYEILLVLALGIPAETVELREAADSIRYYRDKNDIHIVPKRPLREVILN